MTRVLWNFQINVHHFDEFFLSHFLQFQIWPVLRAVDFPVLLAFLDLLDSPVDFMVSLYFRITWHLLHLWPITFFHLQLHPWLANYRQIIYLLKGHFSNKFKKISIKKRLKEKRTNWKLKNKIVFANARTKRDKKNKIKTETKIKHRINVYLVFFCCISKINDIFTYYIYSLTLKIRGLRICLIFRKPNEKSV